uniref:Disease resistance protein RGA3 n=1 Tax=Ananas comosus var. bracteatus TaxID=296719 RepID=A0A6V7PDL7_ANACO|nr:unnamed protein product [Ananas comosus var. bracteatus]
MAEGLVFELVKEVLDKLGSALWNEIGLLRSFKDDVKDLERKLLKIQAVLLDAEERSNAEKENHALRIWLSELKGAAYDIDDLLDEIRTQAVLRKQQRQMRNQNQLARKVCDQFLSCANPIHLKSKFKMAHRMKALREKIDNIAKQRDAFGLVEAGPRRQAEFKRPETFSLVDEKKIVGRDGDKEKIVKLLLESNGDHDVSVIPIVGLGGLGKTTIAQLAFNDGRVTGQQRFDLRVWVCVSTDFDIKTIAKPVISAAGENCALDNSDAVASCLVRIFSQKRFLLVLDDVWNEDQEKWENLKVLFKEGKKGSKILVTTRSKKVAEIMKTVEPHRVKGLSDDDCWTLFKRRAFEEGEENDYPSLVEIGKQIVKKCGGVPLAANALGNAVGFEAVLCLLLHIPKDYTIKKDDLIRQWIALGFISSHETWTSMEDIGDEYFKDLLWMSFLQDMRETEGYVTCRMHDLVHDLAQSVAKEEVAVIGAEESARIPEEITLFVVGKQDRVEHCASISELEHLKLVDELWIKGLENVTSPVDAKAANLIEKNLRSLKLDWNVLSAEEGTDSTVLPAEEIETVLENLQPHQKLSKLEIEGYGGGKFPSWMMNRIGSCLPNLVEIKLDNIPVCSSLAPLGQLPFLEQLYMENMPAVTNLGGVGKFPALTSLDLCSMPMLREWVTVMTVDDEEGRRERVPLFPCLAKLILYECPQFSPEPCLPASVEYLVISGTSSENLSLILERASPLDGGDAAVSLQPPPNKVLQYLIIYECQQLTCLPESLRGLTSLQRLDIWGCHDLERIEDWLGELSDLQSLSISKCRSLRYLPARKMAALQKLHIWNCPLLFDADGQFVDTSVDHIKEVYVNGR